MIILNIYQKQPSDIIEMTPRWTLGICCVHIAQLVTHAAVYTLPFTLQLRYKPFGILQRITKSQKLHISSHDVFQKLHNIDFAWHRSWSFLRVGIEKQTISLSRINIFENNQKPFRRNLRVYKPLKWGAGRKNHYWHFCCNKNFQILLRSDLHQLADDGKENHKYIECLFIL